MIDLHCHSNFSDGVLSPVELIQKAEKNNIKMLALTDHDTIDGLDDFHKKAASSSVTAINGIEISCRWLKYDIHIIGLFVNTSNEALRKLIKAQTESREKRADAIAAKFAEHGIPNIHEKVSQFSKNGVVGRPHFAKILLNMGIVNSLQEAFTRYLGAGKICYVPTQWVDIDQAVAAICSASGIAVLAHPLKYKLTRTKLLELVSKFKAAGGASIEVVSGFMNTQEIKEVSKLASQFNLLSSTGSDFHGEDYSKVDLGRQMALPEICRPVWSEFYT